MASATPTRLVQVGTGGVGNSWCRRILPPFIEEGRLEVVAAVDIDPGALLNAQQGLGLSKSQCYTDIHAALGDHQADALTIVVPPAAHEDLVDVAIAHGLDILSEKPIADSLAGSWRVVEKVQQAGVKMGITLSHRFSPSVWALRDELNSGRNGDLDYLSARFTADARHFGVWGEFRHRMKHPMLIEGSVHHLDILADLAHAPCESVWATTWKPAWAEYEGDTNVFAVLAFSDGTKAMYEAATATAVTMNGWGGEYIRAECGDATLVLDRGEVRRYPRNPGAGLWEPVAYDSGELISPPDRSRWGHSYLLDQFLDWRAGGRPMDTEVAKAIRSSLLIGAAIESTQSGVPVRLSHLRPEGRHPDRLR